MPSKNPSPAASVASAHRSIACLFPDWAATALVFQTGAEPTRPAFVVQDYRVVAANLRARHAGVQVGQRQRDAEANCPEALVSTADPERDARWFESIAERCFNVTPQMEIVRPGLIMVTAAGVARFYGSEEKACEVLITEMEDAGLECHVGIADTLPAAIWAAKREMLLPPGETPHFIAQLPVAALVEEPALPFPETRHYCVETLSALGFRTLGQVRQLSAADMVQRFGAGARQVYDMLSGTMSRKVLPVRLAHKYSVQEECSPPLHKIDEAAFVARRLAVDLQEKLLAGNVCCTAVEVGATTGGGEQLTRVWRCEEALSATAMADRMRWQLDGWLTTRRQREDSSPGEGGLRTLWITPVEVHYAGEQQPDLWSGETARDKKRKKCVSRVQGLLGGEDVLQPVPSGGWGADDSIMWLPYGEKPEKEVKEASVAPWRGRVLPPLPARLPGNSIRLQDEQQQAITVSGRGVMSAPPHFLHVGETTHRIINWAGPWTFNDAWWTSHPERCARLQVATGEGKFFLLNCQHGQWRIEGEY